MCVMPPERPLILFWHGTTSWYAPSTLFPATHAPSPQQADAVKSGVHMLVATPGRLKDMLTKRRMNLDICRYMWACGCRRG